LLYWLNAATLACWAIPSLLVVGLARAEVARSTNPKGRSNWESWTTEGIIWERGPGARPVYSAPQLRRR
jgi:hypothetical protein